MNIWGITDVGAVRHQNQDSYHIELLAEDMALGIVCDGMGGAKAGNVASQLAVETFLETGRPSSTSRRSRPTAPSTSGPMWMPTAGAWAPPWWPLWWSGTGRTS